MKTIRTLLSVVLLSGVAILQLPSLAQCAMAFGYQTVGCHMPCCLSAVASAKADKKMPMKPMPRCADLKAQAAQDALTATSQNPDFSLSKVFVTIKIETRLSLKAFRSRFAEITQHFRHLLFAPDLAGRAPPEDIHLQFA